MNLCTAILYCSRVDAIDAILSINYPMHPAKAAHTEALPLTNTPKY